MKKILFIFLCFCLSITTLASSNDLYEFEYEELGITIVFENGTHFSVDERQFVADTLVFGEKNSEISTYALCWLTGHDYQYEAVAAIEHKKSATAPRCYQTTYKVETCSKCDHMETTVINTTYIFCCPED